MPSYYAPLPIQPHMTAHEAKKQLDGKETNSVVPQSLGFDYSKRSSGTLTTTLHEERQKLVNVLNKNIDKHVHSSWIAHRSLHGW